ncbi:Transglutaminase-like superfamily-domain-containing protein [Scenedesmus sp. NREL 46B-D3]|nr:Transglutaminase-like superfamily-domain-containing protein [Scenedesmus sp. NREL 46B-D3]
MLKAMQATTAAAAVNLQSKLDSRPGRGPAQRPAAAAAARQGTSTAGTTARCSAALSRQQHTTTTSNQGSATSAAAAAEQQDQQQQSPAEPPDVPVLDAALLIAKHLHPELDIQVVKQQLDDLAAEVEAGLPPGVRYPLRVIKEINKVLYEVHGFSGNIEDYYHPDNSCINRVLETKRGIPISLSIVYMEVAARLGLKMAGVNLPAHFMIRPQVEGMELMVDAFNGGQLTALQDAEEVLGGLMGYQVKLDPRFVRGDTPYFSSRQLMLRLLNNLRQIYLTLNMAEEALGIVRYMRATAPAGMLPELQRDEGLCLYGLGRLAEAAEVLGEYLRQGAPSGDAAVVTAVLQKIRERTAEAAAAAAVAAAGGGASASVDEDGDAGAAGRTAS